MAAMLTLMPINLHSVLVNSNLFEYLIIAVL